jgi:predicted SAM-dependent methyltransferase
MTSKYLSPLRLIASAGRRAERLSERRAKARRYADASRWLTNAPRPLKVNVGCGSEPFKGWLNLDLEPTAHADVLWDIRDGLPCPDASCSFIYSEHFLEHLPVANGFHFLQDCHRCLQTGGVVRIAMPSLQEIVRQYYENDWAGQSWLEKYGYSWIKTKGEYININFREWGHEWLYDNEELERRLREAGFSQIESVNWGDSKHPELRSRETRQETLLVTEAAK